ncbi:MAG: SgcJ/EcaC family oxidoreductase [Candidatus Moraniibacteriota bacterium]
MEMQKIAEENFKKWSEALLTGKAENVVALYADENSFLPTVSPEFKTGKIEAEGYFKHFLEKNPKGKVVKERVQKISEKAYLHSGLYDFELGPDDKRQIVEARFTFLWEMDEEKNWLIAHHHSSVKPR